MSKLGMYKRSIIVICTIFIFILITLIGTEIYIRKNNPQNNNYVFTDHKGVIKLKENLDTPFVLGPLKPRIGEGRLPYIQLRTNSYGQRDTKNHAFKKANSVFRIVNLGNSIGLGYPLDLNAIYLTKLQEFISNAEGINCSVPGAGAKQLSKLFENECSLYDADAVIVQLTVSEGIRRSNSLYTDFLPLDFLLEKTQNDGMESSLFSAGYFYDQFHLVRYFVNSRQNKVAVLRKGDKPAKSFNIPSQPDRLEMIVNRSHPTLQALVRIKNIAEKKHLQFIVLLTPASHELRQAVSDPESSALFIALKEMGIEFVDFGEVLTRAGAHASDYYTGMFLNEKAHTTIAKLLAEKLKKN